MLIVLSLYPALLRSHWCGATGSLPGIGDFLGASQFVVRLDLPEDIPEHAKRLGMSGSATMITDEAGAVEILARILFWLNMQLNYL